MHKVRRVYTNGVTTVLECMCGETWHDRLRWRIMKNIGETMSLHIRRNA